MPDADPANRHPAFGRFFEQAKLRSCAENVALFFLFLLSRDGDRQIRR
jgi:hypothetical protein